MPSTYFAGRRILVTGGGGYIGGRLVKSLSELGAEVRVLQRNRRDLLPGVQAVIGDVRDSQIMQAALHGADVVFHLAGIAHRHQEPRFNHEQYDVTVGGAIALMQGIAERAPERLVFVSSVAVYGEPGAAVLDEFSPCSPTTAYGGAKLLAERLLLSWSLDRGVKTTVLRPPLVYGPGAKGNLERLLRLLVKTRGVLPRLPVLGAGRAMVHVDDLIAACLMVCQHPETAGKVYNVTDGHAYTAEEILDAARAALGLRQPMFAAPASGLQRAARVGDLIEQVTGRSPPLTTSVLRKILGPALFSDARIRELGWAPQHTLWSALPSIISAMQSP